MKLLGNRVIVRHDQGSNVSSAIIIIPDIHRKKMAGILATVVEVGEDYVCKSDLKLGDVVVVPEHFGDRGLVPGKGLEDCIMYSGDDVLAKVEV